jgi:type IV pilus assembly protein PilO
MTSGDFLTQDMGFDEPNYPTVLGIQLTPMISGILLGLLGAAIAGATWFYLISPLMEENGTIQADVDSKEEQLKKAEQIKRDLKAAKEELVKVGKQREQVMSLFAKERDLSTLLLDLNQLIERNNSGVLAAKQSKLATCPSWVREQYTKVAKSQTFEDQVGPLVAEARLNKFQPAGVTEVITAAGSDSYVQPALLGKLKRQTIDVSFQGNFNQTQSIFRTIERLQPLLIIKNLSMTLGANRATKSGGLYEDGPGETIRFLTNCQPETLVTTTFKMDALMPASADVVAPPGASPSPAASPGASPSPAASPSPSPKP